MSNHANQSLTNEANQALNFSDVYLSHLPKIKACIRKLDYQSGFKRSTDQINELAQDFFTKVWVDDILSYFDSSKAKSKDAILAYLYNHLRNFYRLFRTKEIRYAETNRKLTINRDFDYISNNQVTKLNPDLRFKLEKISGVLPEEKEKAHKEISKLDVGAVSNFSNTQHNENTGFCYDIKKLGKTFVKSLRGLEKKAWKMFIYDEASADTVAKQLGIGRMTSYRLKDSINSKAKMYLKGYYAGSLTLN
tara:strand:+ start:906 stop:1652 length:747 start_codon:yes stop_codon:yes gene_type:complete